MSIIYNRYTRSFSDQNKKSPPSHLVGSKFNLSAQGANLMKGARKHLTGKGHTLATVGTGLLGAGIGGLGARAIAKKKALAKGLEPGTPEYKAFIKKATIGGAVAGGAVGTGVGYLGRSHISSAAKSMFDKNLKKLRVNNIGSSRTDRERNTVNNVKVAREVAKRLK